jgi:thiol-disulfide isomerase/thioredoxin
MEVPTLNHGVVRLSEMKGKIVLIDFWATWCGPCMRELPHMIAINEKYGPQGLQIIGISLDDAPSPVQRVVKEKSIPWPQHVDVPNRLAREWEVNGIPQVFLIDGEGKVIWEGHPAKLDEPLAAAFIKSPPRLVDEKVLAQATEALDKTESALGANSAGEAMKLLASVPPDASKDAATSTRIKDLQQKLTASAEQMLARVEPMIAEQKYAAAAVELKTIASSLSEHPIAAKAKQKLGELMAKPEARKQIEQAEHIERASEALATAQKLREQKQDDAAYARFKTIMKDYAGTDAATIAAEAVAAYDADPQFVARRAETQAKADANKAKAALSLADSYRRSGKSDLARIKYQQVVNEFAGTKEAETAKAELAKLR